MVRGDVSWGEILSGSFSWAATLIVGYLYAATTFGRQLFGRQLLCSGGYSFAAVLFMIAAAIMSLWLFFCGDSLDD